MKPLYDGEFSTLKGEHELVAENVGLKRKLEAGMEQDGEQVGRDARCVQIVPGKWSVVYGDDPTHPGYANILELANAQEFMDWWKESHERMEASDKFNHTIDYAAAAWDAALTESAALHAEIAKLETIGIEQLAEIQRLTAELAKAHNSSHWHNPETGQAECECCCGWALDYEELRAELSRVREENKSWLRENAPGGWIDNLRKESDKRQTLAEGFADREITAQIELSRERERHQELLDFVQLTEHKLDQRLQGQYTNTQILGMLLKLSRELLLKHKLPAPVVTGEGE